MSSTKQATRNKRLREYDIAKGKLIRTFSTTLVENICKLLPKEAVKKYEDYISIIEAMKCSPLSRNVNGITLEIAIQNLLIELCPKGINNKFWKENRNKSVLRVDEIVTDQNETSLYDLLIDFTIWNKNPSLRLLAIDFLMATNRYESYEEAENSYYNMINDSFCSKYFPIQVKKSSSNQDLMTDKGLCLRHVKSRQTEDIRKLFYEYFEKGRNVWKIECNVSGLFINSFTNKNSKNSIFEISPMVYECDFDSKDFYLKFEILQENNLIKILPKISNNIDIGFIISNKGTNYYISNKPQKLENFNFLVDHKLERDSITDSIFINSAMDVITKKLLGEKGEKKKNG